MAYSEYRKVKGLRDFLYLVQIQFVIALACGGLGLNNPNIEEDNYFVLQEQIKLDGVGPVDNRPSTD